MSKSELLNLLEVLVRPHLKFLSGESPLDIDQNLGEAGLDSMASIDLLVKLEEEFEIVSFHATGLGDQAAMHIIPQGLFQAFIDLVPGAFSEYLLGGNRGISGPDRLDIASGMAIPPFVPVTVTRSPLAVRALCGHAAERGTGQRPQLSPVSGCQTRGGGLPQRTATHPVSRLAPVNPVPSPATAPMAPRPPGLRALVPRDRVGAPLRDEGRGLRARHVLRLRSHCPRERPDRRRLAALSSGLVPSTLVPGSDQRGRATRWPDHSS